MFFFLVKKTPGNILDIQLFDPGGGGRFMKTLLLVCFFGVFCFVVCF